MAYMTSIHSSGVGCLTPHLKHPLHLGARGPLQQVSCIILFPTSRVPAASAADQRRWYYARLTAYRRYRDRVGGDARWCANSRDQISTSLRT